MMMCGTKNGLDTNGNSVEQNKEKDWKCWGKEKDPHQKKANRKTYSYKTNRIEFENSY